jgi:periplasmic protein CpxP/Spy
MIRPLLLLTAGATLLCHGQTPAPTAPPTVPPAAPAPARRPRPTPQEAAEKLAARLSLTGDQKARIVPVLAERQERMQALLALPAERRMKRAHQAKVILDAADERIRTLLTPEQRPRYDALRAELRGHLKELREEAGR